MKYLLLKSLVLIMLCAGAASVNAQTMLEKMQKFAGPSDSLIQKNNKGEFFLEGPGIIYMTDGTIQEGLIRFELSMPTCLLFRSQSASRMEKICSKKIDHFILSGKQFYAVTFKESSMAIGKEKLFMEMLNESKDDKFRLYFMRQQKDNDEKQFNPGPYKVAHEFFVLLPEWDKAFDVNDFRFTPFAKKMSENLKDCPALSEKIKNKEEGYKVNMFNGAANNDVYIRIMQEYNACGK